MNGVATLNGAHFDEALLSIGDRVSIGPVEMVVVECNSAPPIAQIPVEASAQLDNLVQSLQARLDESLEQIERLEVESRQGIKSSIMAAERADQLRDALAETNQQLEEVCGELTAAQDTIVAQAAELEAQAAKISSLNNNDRIARETIELLETQAAAAAAHSETLTTTLNDLQAAQAAERESWTEERTRLTQRCDQLAAELLSVGGELSARSEAATIVFEKHALAGAVADAKLNELTQQLEEKQAEIQTLKHLLDGQTIIASRLEQVASDFEQKCQELTELQGQYDELTCRSVRAQELEQKSQSLEQWQADLSDRQACLADATRTVEAERSALVAKSEYLEAASNGLAQEQQRLADLRRNFEESQAGFSDLDQRRAELDQLASQLETRSTEIEAQAAAVAGRAAELETRQSLLETRSSDVESRASQTESRANEVETRANEIASRAMELDSRVSQLNARAAELESQAAEFASRAATEQNQGLQTIPFVPHEPQAAEIEARSAELDSRAAEINTRVGELQQLLEQLVDQRATLASREQELCERQNTCESRLEEINHQARELATLRDDLRVRSDQLAEQESLARSKCSESSVCQATSSPSNDSSCEEVAHVAEDVAADANHGIENPLAASDGTECEPSLDANAEAEMNSVLSRLVQAGVWRQGEVKTQEMPVAEETPVEVASLELSNCAEEMPVNSTMMLETPQFKRPQIKQPAIGGDDEESIESYMDRLLKRVRGDGDPTQSSGKSSSSGDSLALAAIAEPLANVESVPTVSDSQAAEYSPRRTAPELTSSMSAMRDLANSAARTAIDQHVRLHSSRRATRKLLGACMTVGFSLVMGYWAWRIHSFQAALAAGLGGAIGGYWTMAALRRLSGLKRLDREKESSAAAQTATPDLIPPPVNNA